MSVDNERPPYVVFEVRSVEDRNASIEAGHYVAKDVNFAIVTRPGSRDSLEIEAESWLASLKQKGSGPNPVIPPNWYKGFQAAYDEWKKGNILPAHGTPIKGWGVLSPSLQETLIRGGFLTVEDLAQAGDSELANVGTGGISLKLKAQAWLEAAANAGKSAERVTELAAKIADLTALVEKLLEENKALKAAKPATIKA